MVSMLATALILASAALETLAAVSVNQVRPVDGYTFTPGERMHALFKRNAAVCPANTNTCTIGGGCCTANLICGFTSKGQPACCSDNKKEDCISEDQYLALRSTSAVSSPTSYTVSNAPTEKAAAGAKCPVNTFMCAPMFGGGCCPSGSRCYLDANGKGKCATVCTKHDTQCPSKGCCPNGYTCVEDGCQLANGNPTTSKPSDTTKSRTSGYYVANSTRPDIFTGDSWRTEALGSLTWLAIAVALVFRVF